MKVRHQLTLAILVLALAPLGVLAWMGLRGYRHDLVRTVDAHLEFASDIQRQQVEAYLEKQRDLTRLVTSRTQLRLSLREYLAERDPSEQARLRRILEDAVASIPEMHAAYLYERSGERVAATGSNLPGADAVASGAVPADLHRPEVRPEVFLSPSGVPSIWLLGPLLLKGDRLGVVILETGIGNLVERLDDTAGLGETGETVLVRKAGGGGVEFLAPTRFWPDATLKLLSRKGQGDRECDLFQLEGVHRCRDYRGERVFASIKQIAETDWILVVKVDEAEALAAWGRARFWIISLYGVLGIPVFLLSGWFSNRLIGPLENLKDKVNAIASGNFDSRAPLELDNEIQSLEQHFHAMVERVNDARTQLESHVASLEEEVELRRLRETELKQALSEIQTLKGILPICSVCKKIRDDQGYWNQLEAYMSRYSGVLFSHSLCPECYENYKKDLEQELGEG